MSTRYYGKIYRKEKPTLIEYFVYGLAGTLVGYLIPYIMDEDVFSCHLLSVFTFSMAGLFVGLVHSVWDMPYDKSSVLIIVVFFSFYLLLVYFLC